MRHGKKFNHLSRKAPHRKAMLANMASSLLKHKRINTTVAKAKALRTFIEPLLTRAKDDTTHSRRMVFRYLRDKYAVTELFRDVAPKIADRPGGYTRILKTGNRLGDNAEMCLIELVDFNETMLAEPKSAGAADKKPRTRRGRSKKGSGATDPAKTGLSADLSSEAPAKEEAKVEDKPSVEDAEIVEEVEEVTEDNPTEESAEAATKVEATEENSTDTPEEADVSSEAAAKEEEPDAEETTTEEEPEEEASKEAVEEEAVEEEAVEEETKEGEATEEESTGEEEKKD